MMMLHALVALVSTLQAVVHAQTITNTSTPPPTIDFGALLFNSSRLWSLLPGPPPPQHPEPPPPHPSPLVLPAQPPHAPPSPPSPAKDAPSELVALVLAAEDGDASRTRGANDERCFDHCVLCDAVNSLLALELASDVHLASADYPTDVYPVLPACQFTLLPVQVSKSLSPSRAALQVVDHLRRTTAGLRVSICRRIVR